jgi:tetratricopeptide (TPR) repeat protein
MAEALACWNVKKIEDIQGTPQNVAKFDCAKPKLLSIIQTYPNYADAHRLLAWGYFYKENLYPEAEQEYETAAQLYQKEGQTELAADMLARAAEVYFKEGNKDKAADVAKQALQLDPANTRATTLLRALASAYNADGNKDKACELLNLLLAIDPKNTSAASQKDSLGCK